MATVKSKSKKKSIWAKAGGVVKTGGKIVAEEFKYFSNPRNWSDSGDQVRHEAKQAFNKALGGAKKKYNPSARDVQKSTTRATKALGVEVRLVDYENGIMTFDASRVLAGDVFHLTDEQLNQIKELNKKSEYSKIAVNREKGKIVIEVDVERIINDIKADSKNKGKSEEEIRKLAIKGIELEFDRNLKDIAKITGGEFKKHTDLRLLDAIGKALYREDVSQKKNSEKSSEIVKPVKSNSSETVRSSGQSSETVGPIGMPSKEEILRMAGPLVNSGKRKRESSEDDGQWQKKQKVESQDSKGFKR